MRLPIVPSCLVAFLSVALHGCCGHSDAPCASWTGKNDTFTADPQGALGRDALIRVTGSSLPSESCGAAIQPSGGQTVAFTTNRLTRESGGNEGCECIPRFARFDLSGFEELGGPEEVPRSDHDVLFQANVRLSGSTCEGLLTIGVDPNPERARDPDASGFPAHMLYRTFTLTGDADACEELGVPTPCADAWAVDLHDDKGELVAGD